MGRVLDDSVFSQRRPHMEAYPWDEWLDGRAHELTQDEDFKVSPYSFARAAHAAARKRGHRLRTRVSGRNAIIIQAMEES